MNPRSFDELLNVIPNKFLLTMVIAARAKQLEQGAEKKVGIECTYTNSIDIAIEELCTNKLDIKMIMDGFNDNLKHEDTIVKEIQSRVLENMSTIKSTTEA